MTLRCDAFHRLILDFISCTPITLSVWFADNSNKASSYLHSQLKQNSDGYVETFVLIGFLLIGSATKEFSPTLMARFKQILW
jgi:hypothetical protein